MRLVDTQYTHLHCRGGYLIQTKANDNPSQAYGILQIQGLGPFINHNHNQGDGRI